MSTGEHPNTREAPTTEQRACAGCEHQIPWDWVFCAWCGFENDAPDAQAKARVRAAAPDLLAALKEMGDWLAAGLQASDEAWPDERCLKHTEEIAARARDAVDKAEGRSNG